MGSITPYVTKSGRRYRARYRDPDRKQCERKGFATKRDAEAFLASIEVAKGRGEYLDPRAAKATVGELGPIWLANQSHLKPSSLRPLEIAWRRHVEPVWGSRRVGEIRHSDVQSWVTRFAAGDGKPRSATTVVRAHGVLAGILEVAVRDRRVLANPARDVKLPRKVRREHRYLTHEQVHALAAASGERGALVLLLAYTGLRWGEAIALRTRDLNLLARRINVATNAVEVGSAIEIGTPKNHKRRSVPIPRLLLADLAQQCVGKGPDDLVFADRSGQHLRRTRVSDGSRSWLKTALREVGIEGMTLHDLRHTAASLAVSAGSNVKAVQRMLGHASAAMTLDVYADLFDDDLNAVADRLDEAYSRTVVGEKWAVGRLEAEEPRQIAVF
jgi:integrase